MKWSVVIAGFLVPAAVAWMVFNGEWGHEMRAISARGELSARYAGEPFYPPDDPTAFAALDAARLVWDRYVDDHVAAHPPPEPGAGATDATGPTDSTGTQDGTRPTDSRGTPDPANATDAAPPPTEASLRERFPFLSSLGDGEVRFLSLNMATEGQPIYPKTARLDQGLLVAVNALWEQVDAEDRGADLKERTRFKLDQIVGGYREFPYDGAYSGVALDEGLDGIRLRHDDYDEFHYLPSWSIEHKIDRPGIHGRARKFARQMANWKKSHTKEADFDAFRTRAWVEGKHGGGPPHGVKRGNSDPGEITAALLRERIWLAGQYLTRETGEDGKMTYGYLVEKDEVGSGYNLLRHAGTVYSMMQAYRVEPDEDLLEASKRGIKYYRGKMREDDKNPGEWFVLDGKRAKLGGIGLGLCMMAEMEKANPGYVDMDIVLGMAKHIERMQLDSGEFLSFYDWRGEGVTNRKSIFYSGEALLGLLRVYQITGDEHWLDVAEKGADFLVDRRWVSLGIRLYVPLDAWLIQALEELDRERPDPRREWYAFELSEAISRRKLMDPSETPPDMVGGGVSGIKSLPHAATAGAFGEALSAAARLEARRRPGETRHRTFAFNNAGFQLRNQFHDGNNWHVPNPARAMGSFRERPDDSQTRNDHVQHNLSGLFGLLDLVDDTAPDIGWMLPEERLYRGTP